MQDGDRSTPAYDFLAGGGEIAALMRAHDWASTPLGPIAHWPQSLKTATSILLRSPVPIVMLWGRDGVMIYNDAYSIFAGGRHPKLLGSNVREGWPEVADFNDNIMKVGLAGGTLSYRDQVLTLNRHGVPEQVWLDLDYSPVIDESGAPAGVIAIVVETTERISAEAALRKRERELQIMADNLPVLVSYVDKTERYRFVNSTYESWFPFHRDEMLGRHVSEIVGDEGYRTVKPYMDRAFSGEKASFERFMPYPGAAARHVHIEFVPRRDDAGEVEGFYAMIQDISELRRHETHQRLLINELNHRVKNTLAAVQSIAMQTLRSTQDPREAQARLEGRLLALSKAHDVLTRENWEGAMLLMVIDQAIAPYRGELHDRFSIEGPDIQMAPKTALALSMALHELGTNAVKHGALSSDGGSVGIAWAIAGDPAARELRLRWSETGGPEVRPRTRRGFGSRLLESGLKHDLGAAVELSFAPSGLVCTLSAPLAPLAVTGDGDQGSTSLRT